MMSDNGGSQQLYSYLGRAGLWRGIRDKLAAMNAHLAPCDAKALDDLCAGTTWMQRVPPALLASYRALYVIVRGDAAEEEEEINRDILRTVRAETGLLLDFSEGQRAEFASSINRVLNALALVDGMGYCQGQNYVVDVMLKAGLPERETFCLFLYLLRQGHLHGIYRKEVPMLAGYMDKFEEQLRLRLPDLASHFEVSMLLVLALVTDRHEAEHYPPPLYALEWMTTLFGLAARPLVSLVALDLCLAGARNPVLRLCVSLLGMMEDDLLAMDQEGMLREFRAKAVTIDAESAVVRALSEGGGKEAEETRSRAGAHRPLGWSTGPDYLLVLRSRHCQTVGFYELREEARSDLLLQHSALQDALLAVTRSLGWGRLRTCWLESCLSATSDYERYRLANESLRFVIANGGHSKAAGFMLGLAGANANGVDSRLLSPLHLAALFNRPDVARMLLMCGASPKLVGGVTRAAAARGGKLWTPLEMAEEACAEGGELDEAGVAVGPAALFVLRGTICLQCNVKLSKPSTCESCRLSYCKSCSGDHFCVGRLDLPKGVEMSTEGSTPSDFDSVSSGRSGGGCWESERREGWALGSAICDGWETLFTEVPDKNGLTGNVNGDGDWVPGGLRRFKPESSLSSTSTRPPTEEGDERDDESQPEEEAEIVWSTVHSVLLGSWERRPVTSSPKDRDRVFDNAAAFVRACFPAQTWLQYHMEDELGLSMDRDYSVHSWGGLIYGLGMRGEFFEPAILRVAESTELHRRMSWVMAETGVPWERDDDAWCCPECFILFSLNVFRHHCRGCGNIYCSAHAPATPVPPSGRILKLCWSCVLEGAVPLSSIVPQEDEVSVGDYHSSPATTNSTPGTTARGFANQLSPYATAAAVSLSPGTYNSAQPPSPSILTRDRTLQEIKSKGGGVGGGGGGFLSALVSLIETVAAPITPERSRAGARRKREGARSASAASLDVILAAAAQSGTLNTPDSDVSSGRRSDFESVGLLSAADAGARLESAAEPMPVERDPATASNAGASKSRHRRALTTSSAVLAYSGDLNGDGKSSDRADRSRERSRQPPSGSQEEGDYSAAGNGTLSSTKSTRKNRKAKPDPSRPIPQRGFGSSPKQSEVGGSGALGQAKQLRANLQRGSGSSVSTVSSLDAGEEDEMMPLQRGFGTSGSMKRGFPSEGPMKRDFGPR